MLNIFRNKTLKPATDASKEKDRLQKIKICEEIVATEEAYVAYLQALVEVYEIPLSASANSDHAIITKDVVANIFSNISIIYSLHSKFLIELQTVLKNFHIVDAQKTHAEPTGGIILALLSFSHYFKMYTQFVNNYGSAAALVADLIDPSSSKRNKPFIKFCMDAEKNAKSKGHSLSSLLVNPVQRVPRYKLLLTELAKRIDHGTEDATNIEKALSLIDSVANHINEALRSKATSESLILLQSQWLNSPIAFLEPRRVFFARGPISIPLLYSYLPPSAGGAAKNTNPVLELVLFNDVAVIGKRKKKDLFKYICHFKIKALGAAQTGNGSSSAAPPVAFDDTFFLHPNINGLSSIPIFQILPLVRSDASPLSPNAIAGHLEEKIKNAIQEVVQRHQQRTNTSPPTSSAPSHGLKIVPPSSSSSTITLPVPLHAPAPPPRPASQAVSAAKSATTPSPPPPSSKSTGGYSPFLSPFLRAPPAIRIPDLKSSSSAYEPPPTPSIGGGKGESSGDHAVGSSVSIIPAVLGDVSSDSNKRGVSRASMDFNVEKKSGPTIELKAETFRHPLKFYASLEIVANTPSPPPPKEFIVYCDTLESKIDWIQRFCLAIASATETRDSFFIRACALGAEDVAMHLLNYCSPNVNAKHLNGFTALHYTALTNCPSLTAALLAKGALVNELNDDGLTPLLIAARYGHSAVLELLVKHNDIDLTIAKEGYSAFDLNDVAVFQAIDPIAQRALFAACKIGHFALAVRAINAKANLDSKDSSGMTPLMIASIHGHRLLIELFLELMVDANAINNDGATALIIATEIAHPHIVALLLDFHLKYPALLNIDKQNKTGRTAREIAQRHPVIAQLFLEKCPPPPPPPPVVVEEKKKEEIIKSPPKTERKIEQTKPTLPTLNTQQTPQTTASTTTTSSDGGSASPPQSPNGEGGMCMLM